MQNKPTAYPRPPRQRPPWQIAVIDIVLIGLCLVIFALFDHVIPSAGQKVVYTAPVVSGPTAAPTDAIAPEDGADAQAAEVLSEPSAPTEAPAAAPAVGDFSDKFADKFTDGEIIQTETSYQSANLNVNIYWYKDYLGTKPQMAFVEDIYIRNIECLRGVFAQDTFGHSISENVLSMAQRTGVVCAINADFCGYGSAGICIRNGVLYRREYQPGEEVLIIYRDGTMRVFPKGSDVDVDQVMADGAWQSFSFGPSLLDVAGNLRTEGYEKVNHDPRTFIGMIEPGHYLFVVADGRQKGYSEGLTYYEAAVLAQRLGCTVAYNLDGGKTSQMTFMGRYVNQPYNGGRDTSDLICIADAQP